MNRRWICSLGISVLLLAGCAGSGPAANNQANPTSASTLSAATSATGGTQPAPASTATEIQPTVSLQRGPGQFDLAAMDTGLEKLARFQAILTMIFDGTKDGQPYHTEKTYTQTVDHSQKANLLVETTKSLDGSSATLFSGTLGDVRYGQAASGQPCQASQALQESQFTPATLLPHMLGVEAGGQETVGTVAADVYSFDQNALGAGEDSTATGKVWIAQEGGWVVKYELSLQSAVIFGEGISGVQTWEYTVVDPGDSVVKLPDGCPLPLTDVPVPDGVTGLVNLPSQIRYQTQLSKTDLAAYYTTQLTALGYLQQGQAIETSGGTRWVYGKQDGDQAVVLVITAEETGSSLSVNLVRLLATAPAQ